MSKTLLIDGSNLYQRAFWACARSPEQPNFIFVFLRMLHSYAVTFKAGKMILCWDLREEGEANKRKELLEEYKAHRPDQKDIYADFPKLKEITEYLGIKHIFPKNLEADDILYYLATQKYPGECIVITRDTDLFQLVESKYNVEVYEPNKKVMVDAHYLLNKFEVLTGNEFIIRKALKGDSADNIKGISRIRKERINKVIDWLKQNPVETCPELSEEEIAIFNRNISLMKLDKVLSEQDEIEHYKKQLQNFPKLDRNKFRQVCYDEKFFSIVNKFDAWVNVFATYDIEDLLNDLI